MKLPSGRFSTGVFVLGVLAALPLSGTGRAAQALAVGEQLTPETHAAVHMDLSPPLRGILSVPLQVGRRGHPVGPLPIPLPVMPARPDPVVQTTTGAMVGTIDELDFAGLGRGAYGFVVYSGQPDANLAVGARQVVQWVNTSVAVFDKATGAIAAGFPKAGKTVWSGFGGGCEANNDGDPIVQYDKLADRWVLSQFSVSSTPYLQCVAVSTTSDATGAYTRYAFDYGNVQFPDYPKIGVWPDAYYISFNIFDHAQTFAGAKVCAYDRSSMLAGAAATQQCVQLGPAFGGLLPSDLDGTTAPPAGSPNHFLNFGANSLNLWQFHVDWADPGNTALSGPTSIPVAAFTPACSDEIDMTCIRQKSSRRGLMSFGDRLMYRLAYRNFAGDHEAMVVNHAVRARPDGVTGVRWYELRKSGDDQWSIFQQGTYAPDANFRWMGSIAMDRVGDIAVGYSVSSAQLFPSIRYTGRVATDPPGTLQAEKTVIAGGGSQQGFLAFFWGDYTSMSVDPVDDCTFWYTNEYLESSGTLNWSTRIASFKFTSCQ